MPKWQLGLGRKVQHLKRYRHIVRVLMKYGFEEVAGSISARFKLGPGRSRRIQAAKMQQRSRPERLRLALEELGPTFIKLGQLLSTRPDIVSPEYLAELERLQDQVPPVPYQDIKAEIEDELGDTVENLFLEFDTKPLAAGSIAQVHRALTRQGQQVVTKIRRPNIEETIATECGILHDISGLLKATVFEEETVDPQRMVDEFTEAVMKEVDLSIERRSQLRFSRKFKDDPTMHIPTVYEQYCSEGVLTMEYIKGIRPGSRKVVEDAGLDPKLIAKRGADFVLKQVFDLGFFHTDPHPGNFFLLEDNILAPLDFGQVARLSTSDRNLLNEMVLSIVDNDAKRIIVAIERANMLHEKTNMAQLSRDAEDLLDTYHDMPLREIPFGRVITQIFEIMRKNRIHPPAQFTLMLKTMMTIESFADNLDPDFQIIDHLKPYAWRFKVEQFAPGKLLGDVRRGVQDAAVLAGQLPDDINAIMSKFRRGQFSMHIHHEHLQEMSDSLNDSSNRISFALIIAGLLIASSFVIPQDGSVFGVSLQSIGLIGYILAGILGLTLIFTILRKKWFS